MADRFPIPGRMAWNPVVGGVALPWANVRLGDGGADFRSHHHAKWLQCWSERLCQVCGDNLVHPIVLLGGPNQLRHLLFDEPPLHPECAVYTSRACPMVNGERTHYADRELISQGKRGRACYDPGCDCGGWVEHPNQHAANHGGDPAHEWYAVYIRAYTLAARPDGSPIGGVCAPDDVLVVRLVSQPGEGRCWVKVTDWRDRYEAPEMATEGVA